MEGIDPCFHSFIRSEDELELPCTTIANYEAAPFVFWKGLTLQAEKRTKSVSEDKNGKKEVVKKKYVPTSTFIADYFDTLVKLIEHYFPNDDLMEVTSALNQRQWPVNVDKILETPRIMNGLQKWPRVMDLQDEIPDMTEDIHHLIRVLKLKTVRWCDVHTSKPSHFWNRLLVKGLLTTNLQKLVERTITIPYGSSDAERAFRYVVIVIAEVNTCSYYIC